MLQARSVMFRAGKRACNPVYLAQVGSEGAKMEADDDDIPAAYLLFTVAAIIVIGVAAAGAFIILIRS
jgi:hypothetical protein